MESNKVEKQNLPQNGFWSDTYRQSLKEMREKFPDKWEAIRLVIAIIWAVVGLGLSIATGIIDDWDAAATLFWGAFGSEIFIIFVLQISIPIGAFFRLPIVASKIANEKDKEIECLKRKLQPDDPFIFEKLSPISLHNDAVWVGLEIINDSYYPIVNASASAKMDNMSFPVAIYYYPLNGGPTSELIFNIPRQSRLPFYFLVCGTGKNWPNAVLNTPTESARRIYQGKYNLSFKVRGENSNGKLVEHTEEFTLIYEGENKLELTPVAK